MEVSFFDRVGTVPVLVERHGQMNEATDPGVTDGRRHLLSGAKPLA